MKILVATEKPFAKKAVDGIREIFDEAGYEVVLLEKYSDKQQLLDAVADAEGLIVRSDKVTAEVLDAAKKLKIVVRAGAGYDNVDLEAATAHGVVVMNTPGQNANAVAELTIAMMIFMARNGFTPGTGMEVRGKRLGIVAYGAIGRIVADVADGLGMYVHVYSRPNPNKIRLYAKHLRRDDTLEQMFTESNFVSLHMPSTPETKGMIGYDLIKLMPQGGVLINTARKELIDEQGLIRAFEERPDLKYVTDIAPVAIEEMKEKFGNRVFATSKKMGAETAEANMNAGLAAARQIVGYLRDGNNEFQVNN
ncbi:MAG: 3-phosphoglycerate dehydrogenase [Alistipes sp.]|jgi:D-3-phosphoglycerate dehydrogenase|nr:3-phosphoglycerate dehydrogenase [Alistipes sp.]